MVLALAMFWPVGSAVYIYLANRVYLLQGLGRELPALLQKLCVLYYVRALTPVPAPRTPARRCWSSCSSLRPRRPR